jgi:hypothetical protein
MAGTRSSSVVASLIVIALTTTACGSDGSHLATGSAKEFCADWSNAKAAGLDGLDMQKPASLRIAADTLEKTTYPPALTDDAQTVIDGMRSLASALNDKPYATRTPSDRQTLLRSHKDAFDSTEALRVFARRC